MKNTLKPFILCPLVVAVAVQLAGCGATAGMRPSQVATNQFMQQMKAGKPNVAYGLLSAPCKAATSQQQMQNYWDLVVKNRGEVQSWTQQGVQLYSGTGGSSVNLGYSLQCANGTSAARFGCVQENDKWVINNFYFNG